MPNRVRYAFDPAKWTEYAIPFGHELYPPSAGIFDDPAGCAGINERWMHIFVRALAVLQDERVWTTGIPDTEFERAYRQVGLGISKLLQMTDCFECPDCPEPPENPPEPPKNGAGGGMSVVQEVGILGLTVHELEEMILMFPNMRPIYGWVDGVLSYWDAGCCEYRPFPVISGDAPVGGTIEALTAGVQSLDDWIAGGQTPTEDIADVPHEKLTIYTTDDSLKCAKATAIVEHIFQSIAGWKDVMDNMPTTISTATGVGLVLASVFPGVQYVLGMISKVVALLSAVPAGVVAGQLQTDFEKQAEKQALICDLVPRMTAPGLVGGFLKTNRMTDADIIVAFERFEAIVQPHANTRSLLGFFPIIEWKQATASRMETEECGCDDFLPHGYNPPLPEGQMMLEFAEFGYASPAFLFPVAGSPYPAIYADGRRGEVFGTSAWATELTDVGGGYETGFLQAVFLFTSPVTISQISALFTFPDGTPSNDVQFGMAHFSIDNGGEWEDGIGWGSINEFPEIYVSARDINGFAIAARGTNQGTFRRVVLSQVLVSGTFLGEPFINLPVGQVFSA